MYPTLIAYRRNSADRLFLYLDRADTFRLVAWWPRMRPAIKTLPAPLINKFKKFGGQCNGAQNRRILDFQQWQIYDAGREILVNNATIMSGQPQRRHALEGQQSRV